MTKLQKLFHFDKFDIIGMIIPIILGLIFNYFYPFSIEMFIAGGISGNRIHSVWYKE